MLHVLAWVYMRCCCRHKMTLKAPDASPVGPRRGSRSAIHGNRNRDPCNRMADPYGRIKWKRTKIAIDRWWPQYAKQVLPTKVQNGPKWPFQGPMGTTKGA